MPRARRSEPEEEGGGAAWLASWSDAVTLLMAFFVVLYAFSLQDTQKLIDFKVGVVTHLGIADPSIGSSPSLLHAGSGIGPGGDGTMGTELAIPRETQQLLEQINERLTDSGGIVTPANIEDIKALIEARLAGIGAAEVVDVDIDDRGVAIHLPDHLLFESGKATFDTTGGDNEFAPRILGQVAHVLNTVDNHIEVIGHTDNVPTGNSWPSNWELSGARASAVVRWFSYYAAIPEARMVAIGRSDTQPRESNATAEGRRRNRRVEIVIRVDGLRAGDVVSGDVELIKVIDPDVIGIGLIDGIRVDRGEAAQP